MKNIKLLFGLLLIAVLAGCSSVVVKSDYNDEVEFGRYQTYQWKAPEQNSEEYLASQNPLLNNRIQTAIAKELAAKGLHNAQEGQPSFLVYSRIEFKDKHRVISTGYDYWPSYYGFGYRSRFYGYGYWPRYYGYGYRLGYYGEPVLRQYKEITITLDFVDPNSRELIWRGWYSDEVDDAVVKQEKIDEAIRKLLEKYPPDRQKRIS